MRKVLLKVHLILGLAAGLFLVVLGLTGSVMAFEGDIGHWLHPRLWYVAEGGQPLAEGELIAGVEQRFAPARVGAVELSQHRDLAQLMQLTDHSNVTVNPYTGAVLGRWTGPTRADVWLGYIHQIHLRLAKDGRAAWAPAGKIAVSYAGLALFLLAPTGLVLWWRTKRGSIHWKASWFKVFFDAHQAMGIYAGLFLWVAALTGMLIGFPSGEKAIYALTHSGPPKVTRPPASTPVPGATPIGLDRAIAVAQQAIPNAAVDLLLLPPNPKGVYRVILRVPEETSGSAHSSVVVDQFSGQPLAVHNFLTGSEGYRWIRFNRSIHTGDIGGLAGHLVMSLSSLLLVAMVITGVVIWLKRLAV
ncbi:MAG TPA: PepSY-associated TM helix domain-containing protein [Bryobacteraceae bacterium]|nr:PepSY-associated TM helix domain-containing protein [Bryobacteraceae bacterium]